MDDGNWSPIRCNLMIMFWQLSRILTGSRFHGEDVSLNMTALHHFLDMKNQGRLPLGPPLPLVPTETEETEMTMTSDDDNDLGDRITITE